MFLRMRISVSPLQYIRRVVGHGGITARVMHVYKNVYNYFPS